MNTIKILMGISLTLAAAAEWSEPQEVRMRRDHVLTYRAMLSGNTLIIEAVHEDGWHSYAMDNIIRAREASGKEKPDCELPTRIEVSGALSIAGSWHQSDPSDLSNTDIKWYTYGFEGVAYFAATVKRGEGDDAIIQIDAQACNDSKCSMVDGLELTLPMTDQEDDVKAPIDLSMLVEVEVAAAD